MSGETESSEPVTDYQKITAALELVQDLVTRRQTVVTILEHLTGAFGEVKEKLVADQAFDAAQVVRLLQDEMKKLITTLQKEIERGQGIIEAGRTLQ